MSEIQSPVFQKPTVDIEHHAASVALTTYTEHVSSGEALPELREKIGEYFDTHITSPFTVRTEGAVDGLQRYKGIFTNTAIEVFGPRATDATSEYNSRLGELTNILTSIDHNAGVYYEKDDVDGIFTAVAHEIFDDPAAKHQLASDAAEAYSVIQMRATEVTSIDREVSLPLLKDESGNWRVVGNQEYDNIADFKPLEVLRQDNTDKAGYGKYRFRQPIYTRSPDAMHAKEVGDGWYTSEWYQDPNYWSAQIRDVLNATVAHISRQVEQMGASVTFVTEGGVFKGTATEGTDVDTSCLVSCNSPADFAEAYEGITSQLNDCLGAIPFDVKRGPGFDITPTFFDKSTGQQYYRNDSGEFKVLNNTGTVDGNLITQVRRHEKGVMITTADGITLFRKPKSYDNKSSVDISISPNGTVRQVSRPLTSPRPATADTNIHGDESEWM